jgi:hypothetical protein
MKATIVLSLFFVTLCIFCLCDAAKSNDCLKIYSCFEEGFQSDTAQTEEKAYEAIISQQPKIKAAYFAVPWDSVSLSLEAVEQELTRKLAGKKIKNGCTVVYNLSWNFERLFPTFCRLGIKTVFTPCATIRNLEYKKYDKITVVPFPYFAKNEVTPAPAKDILYCFIGSSLRVHPVRAAIFSMPHPKNAIVIRRGSWMDPNGVDEYKDVLSRSRYCLVPPGCLPPSTIPNAVAEPGAIRFYEALSAGAIPVLINDRWLLPYGYNWKRCVVKVAEKDVGLIPQILAKISPKREKKMRAAALEAYRMFSGKNFISVIRNHFKNKSSRNDRH